MTSGERATFGFIVLRCAQCAALAAGLEIGVLVAATLLPDDTDAVYGVVLLAPFVLGPVAALLGTARLGCLVATISATLATAAAFWAAYEVLSGVQ